MIILFCTIWLSYFLSYDIKILISCKFELLYNNILHGTVTFLHFYTFLINGMLMGSILMRYLLFHNKLNGNLLWNSTSVLIGIYWTYFNILIYENYSPLLPRTAVSRTYTNAEFHYRISGQNSKFHPQHLEVWERVYFFLYNLVRYNKNQLKNILRTSSFLNPRIK